MDEEKKVKINPELLKRLEEKRQKERENGLWITSRYWRNGSIELVISAIATVILLAGAYLIQDIFCPCNHEEVQILSQYASSYHRADMAPTLGVIGGALLFGLFFYLFLGSALEWIILKLRRIEEKEYEYAGIAVLVFLIICMLLAFATLFYVWADVSCCTIITETGLEEHGVFSDEYYAWDDMTSFSYEAGDGYKSTVVTCWFDSGEQINIRVWNYNHCTDAFYEKYDIEDNFIQDIFLERYEVLKID